jgi:hypothetical protein
MVTPTLGIEITASKQETFHGHSFILMRCANSTRSHCHPTQLSARTGKSGVIYYVPRISDVKRTTSDNIHQQEEGISSCCWNVFRGVAFDI